MKRIALVLAAAFLVTVGFSAQAQSGLPISKDVQKVANKKALENQEQSLQTTSVPLPALVVSKSIQSIPNPALITADSQGNMKSKGTPAWVNSKGVHRMNQSENKSKKSTDMPSDELVKAN